MLYELKHSLAVVKPTQLFLNWIDSTLAEDSSFLTLEALRINSNSYLIPEIEEIEEGILYIDEKFEEIFTIELHSWVEDRNIWPEITLKNFWEWFDVEIHSSIIDLESVDTSIYEDVNTASVTIH